MAGYSRSGLRQALASILGEQKLCDWIVEESERRSSTGGIESIALEMAQRYLNGEPIQYIFGHWSFRSLELACDARALIPRPETEYLVELAKSYIDRTPDCTKILEIGTGTGAIALSLAAECSGLIIRATDISPDALSLAKKNLGKMKNLLSEVSISYSNLFDSLGNEKYDLIISNPPYVPTQSKLPSRVIDYEPHLALFAGNDGFDVLGRIVRESVTRMKRRGSRVLLEMDESHSVKIRESSVRAGFNNVEIIQDLAGRDRFAWLEW